jgi:hypothetical protein
LEHGPHQLAEIRELRPSPLATDQRPAEFLLQLLHRLAQRRLGDLALPGCAGEVQRPRQGQETSDLMEFHGSSSTRRNPAERLSSGGDSAIKN